MNKGDIIEIKEFNKCTSLLPSGTIFKVIGRDDDYVEIEGSLIIKAYNVLAKSNSISYVIINLSDEARKKAVHYCEGYALSDLNGFKLEIIKIPNHKNGIE